MKTTIHPTAVVDSTAKLDSSVVVGPYAVIGEGVVMGPGCAVGAHAVVEHAHLGRENKLFPGCYVGGAPQDLKYAGEKTVLVMGDKNTVRECATLNRGTAAHGETRIGNGCLFMAYSHVAHDCIIGNGVILVNSVALAGHVEVGDFAVLGGLAAVHQYTRIGKYMMAGGGSMIGKDVPPFCTCQGDRATLRGLNLLGMRRAGMSRDAMQAVKAAYKTLFLSGLRQEEALAQIRSDLPGPEVSEFLDFIERSKRGVMRPAAGVTEEEEVSL